HAPLASPRRALRSLGLAAELVQQLKIPGTAASRFDAPNIEPFSDLDQRSAAAVSRPLDIRNNFGRELLRLHTHCLTPFLAHLERQTPRLVACRLFCGPRCAYAFRPCLLLAMGGGRSGLYRHVVHVSPVAGHESNPRCG